MYLSNTVIRFGKTSLFDPDTKLSSAIVGAGGRVFALCQATTSLDPGRLFIISPHGVVEKQVDIHNPATMLSWPTQASSPGLPIITATANSNKVYRGYLDGDLELFYEYPDSSVHFTSYPAQVDPNGNVYLTTYHPLKNDVICSVDSDGQERWSHPLSDKSFEFSAGLAIDCKRRQIYAKYYDGTNDTAHLLALNVDTGSEIWNKAVPAVPSLMAAAGEPTIGDDGTVFAKFYNVVRAYNPDGSWKWEYQVNAGQEYIEPFLSLGPHENLYVGGMNFASVPKYAWLRSIKIVDKTVLWEYSKPCPPGSNNVFGAPAAAVGNKMVFTTLFDMSGHIPIIFYALRDNGSSVVEVWDHNAVSTILLGSTGAAYLLDTQAEKIIALSGGEVGDPDGAGMGYTNNSSPDMPSNVSPGDGAANIEADVYNTPQKLGA